MMTLVVALLSFAKAPENCENILFQYAPSSAAYSTWYGAFLNKETTLNA